jgi:hypothetical protein
MLTLAGHHLLFFVIGSTGADSRGVFCFIRNGHGSLRGRRRHDSVGYSVKILRKGRSDIGF